MKTNQLFVMLDMLMEGATVPELVLGTGCSRQTVRRSITTLHERQHIHILEYVKDKRGHTNLPRYGYGKKPDAKRKPHDHNAAQRAYTARRRAIKAAELAAQAAQAALADQADQDAPADDGEQPEQEAQNKPRKRRKKPAKNPNEEEEHGPPIEPIPAPGTRPRKRQSPRRS